ncbi:MAG: isoprenylcysteine carboxylmethyltransferase family protein [Gaiellaceae bacterium]
MFLKHKVGRALSGGGRGGGWVWLQFAVMAVLLGVGLLPPEWPNGAQRMLTIAGLVLVVSGGGIAVWATRLLGRGFTPFPRPLASGELINRGPYCVVRHPIYSAGLLFFTGYSLYAGVLALVATGALGVVWALKARVEEGFLRERYPGYGDYASDVRFRLIPLLY